MGGKVADAGFQPRLDKRGDERYLNSIPLLWGSATRDLIWIFGGLMENVRSKKWPNLLTFWWNTKTQKILRFVACQISAGCTVNFFCCMINLSSMKKICWLIFFNSETINFLHKFSIHYIFSQRVWNQNSYFADWQFNVRISVKYFLPNCLNCINYTVKIN